MSGEYSRTQLVPLAKGIASKFMLPPWLVCAVIEEESNWNPWTAKYDAVFCKKFVAPLYTSQKISASEAWLRAYKWGLMQVHGQVARDNGVSLVYLNALCDPETGISIGCTVLAKKLDAAKNDIVKALLAWHDGGNPAYAGQVAARMEKYR